MTPATKEHPRMTRKRGSVSLVVIVGALVAGVGMAWACTVQPTSFAISRQAGPVGAEVDVRGEGFVNQGLVEVRWNGLEGASLAQTVADENGRFSVPVRIPSAAPDIYFVVAVGDAGVARAAFEVTASASAPPSPSRADQVSWNTGAVDVRPGGNGWTLPVGVGLLGVGLVTLLGAFAAAPLARRRGARRLA